MPAVSQSYASFRLSGDGLVPDVVTDRLGLTPTHAHAKGDPVETSRRPGAISRTGVWLIESALAPSFELNAHLEQLLDMLEPVRAELLTLIDAGCVADFYCLLNVDGGSAGLELPPETLARIASIRATLGLAIEAYELPCGVE